MASEKILVVEDDKNLVKLLKYNLEKAGFEVAAVMDGAEGLKTIKSHAPSLVVLDVMIPKLDGFEFLRVVRKDSRVPIVMLTARKEEMDRVLGLEMGADDYVTKPFSVRELVARIKTVLRRSAERERAGGVDELSAGALHIDFKRYETTLKGKPIPLTTKEYQFIKCLIEAGGRAMTREEILERVWGYDRSMEIDTHTVDQHVLRLRGKLGAEAVRLVTVKGVGYRFKTD
ncbi:MAG: response regulator transcription factor [Proteobacteria bacterium]|nr:response regulator transcription factor [Pseudomonadota bacterium]